MSDEVSIALTPALLSDQEFLLRLRNDPEVAAQSFSGPVDSPAVHASWVVGTLRNPATALFVATERGQLVGMGRLDAAGILSRKEYEAELSLAVCPEARGRGVGTAIILGLIAEADARWPAARLVARIQEQNHGSRTAFSRAGFRIEEISEGVVTMSRVA